MANKENGVTMGLVDALKLGLEHQKTGNISEATSIYREILQVDPNNAYANYLLGGLALEAGDFKSSVSMLEKALSQTPGDAALHTNLGNALVGANRPLEGIDQFQKALEIDPTYMAANNYLGNVLQQYEKYDEAMGCFNQVLEADPDNASAHNNLGNVFAAQELFDDALDHYAHAIKLKPDYIDAYYNQAVVSEIYENFELAEKSYVKALELNPANVNANFNFGNLLYAQKRYDEAETYYCTALALDPQNVGVLNNLGITQRDGGNVGAALESWKKALDINPDIADCHYNLGLSNQMMNLLADAEPYLRKTLELDPEYPNASLNLSMNLFMQGKLGEGWDMYEFRWLSDFQKDSQRDFHQPLWDGSNLSGKSILLWGEQGLGDEIRYASMVQDVIDSGADVTIECDRRLVDLFARSFDGVKVQGRPFKNAESGDVEFDFQCPLASLGRYFRVALESFANAENTFLKEDSDKHELWNARLAELGDNPKVGIIWGSMIQTEDRAPSFANIDELEPLLSIPGIDFVNLNYDECSAQIAQAKEQYGVTVHEWDDIDLKNDLDDVAALISSLDLVITYPSAVGEMSAALGIKTLEFWAEKTHAVMLGTGEAIWNQNMIYYAKNPDEPWAPVFDVIAETIREKFALED